MNIEKICEEGCSLPSSPKDIEILINNLIREVKILQDTTEAKLLKHDGKIAEMCKYIKDNLSNSLKCLINTMKLSGEIDEIIIDVVSNTLSEIKKMFVTPEMFGALGNGKNDDTTAIMKALIFIRDNDIKNLVFNKNKTYLVRGYEEGQAEGSTTGLLETIGLNVLSNTVIDLNGSSIKCIANARQNYNIFTINQVENVTIQNGSIIGDVDSHKGTAGEWGYGISIRNSKNIHLKNLYITKCWGDGINLNNDGTDSLNENIIIENCICDDNRRQGMSIENGKNIKVVNSEFINTGKTKRTNPTAGVDVEPGNEKNQVIDLLFENCNFEGNYNCGLTLDGSSITDVIISKCKIKDNKGKGSYSSFNINNPTNVKVMDSVIDKMNGNGVINVIGSGLIEFRNNKIVNSNMTIKNNTSDNYVKIINNIFTGNMDMQWNAVIESVPLTNTTKNNTLIVERNIFKYAKDNLIGSYVKCNSSAHFDKLIAKNNIFYNGNTGINVNCSSEIESNTFISARNNSIAIHNNTENVYHNIKNNQFEHSNCMVEGVGAIYNAYNKNLVLMNNVIYKVCTNSNDTNIHAINSAVRLLQNLNPTGKSLDVNNYVLD